MEVCYDLCKYDLVCKVYTSIRDYIPNDGILAILMANKENIFMAERLIAPVTDNLAKYYTYREFISRYNRAMKESFYFEALLIDYAMLQDRLRSFLFHMGALKTRKSTKVDFAKAKNTLQSIVAEYKQKGDSQSVGITSITGKMRIIRCVAQWTATTETVPITDSYAVIMKRQMEGLDIALLLSCLDDISAWCKYRNEIIHCLLNKSVDSVDARIAEQAENGFRIARTLDTLVRQLQKGNVIRKKMNLPIDKQMKVPKAEK